MKRLLLVMSALSCLLFQACNSDNLEKKVENLLLSKDKDIRTVKIVNLTYLGIERSDILNIEDEAVPLNAMKVDMLKRFSTLEVAIYKLEKQIEYVENDPKFSYNYNKLKKDKKRLQELQLQREKEANPILEEVQQKLDSLKIKRDELNNCTVEEYKRKYPYKDVYYIEAIIDKGSKPLMISYEVKEGGANHTIEIEQLKR